MHTQYFGYVVQPIYLKRIFLVLQVVKWQEPLLKGDMPLPRKGAAAAVAAGRIVMVGGTCMNNEDQPVVLDEVVVFDMEGSSSLVCKVNPMPAASAVGPVSTPPPARTGASLLEYQPGKLFLYGGVGADNKPLNDAFLLDVETMIWTQVFNGSSDLVGPDGKHA
jgi:dynein heavy chain